MNKAALNELFLQFSGLSVADVTAVDPKSQDAFEVAAAQGVSENIAAPIPQSEYGFGALPTPPGLCLAKTEKLTDAITIARINFDDLIFMTYHF
jgi:hypothetical protein